MAAAVGNTWYKGIAGRWMKAEGDYQDNPKYGLQFRMENLKVAATPYHEAVARALSRRVKPFRRSNQDYIFQWLREHLSYQNDVLKIWKGDLDFLRSGEHKDPLVRTAFRELAQQLEDNQLDSQLLRRGVQLETREWWKFLCYGSLLQLNLADIIRIFITENEVSPADIKEDPYCILKHRGEFADSTDYLSWTDWVDYVARYTNRATPEKRLGMVVFAALTERCWNQKAQYLPEGELRDRLQPGSNFFVEHFKNAQVTDKNFKKALQDLRAEGSVVIHQGKVYLTQAFKTEVKSAQYLQVREEPGPIGTPTLTKAMKVAATEMKTEGVNLSDRQKEAVEVAMKSRVSVITGLPGTGKTTALRALVQVVKAVGEDVLLVAPTGIAAKNVAQATGHEAATIHRAFQWQGGDWHYNREKGRMLTPEVLVVDEASMLSTDLLHALTGGVWPRSRIVFVGDPEQIPSVATGNVFQHLIKAIPDRVHLVDIHRQAENSGIIQLAHDISRGQIKDLDQYKPDVQVHAALSTNQVLKKLKSALPAPGFDPLDFQIVTPTNRGVLGTVGLNRDLADVLNPGPRTFFGLEGFRDGDKVVVVRNNYDLEIWNGDIGILRNVSSTGAQLELFGVPEPVQLSAGVLADEVKLAYAITIHKAQGSEFGRVCLVLDPDRNNQHVYRNLIYTGVTRARSKLDFVGDEGDFYRLAKKPEALSRHSHLVNWIAEFKQGNQVPVPY